MASYLDIYFGSQRNPNQVVFNCIAFTVPLGVPSKEAATVPVKLTVLDSDDIKVASEKRIRELIKFKIIRIIEISIDKVAIVSFILYKDLCLNIIYQF